MSMTASIATGWRERVIGEAEVDPQTLRENPRNWRAHPGKQQQAMAGILDEVGFVQQVLVNKRTGVIVDGHLRVALATKRKQPAIPVTYVDLSDEEEALVLATLNPLGALAYEDAEQRQALLASIAADRAALAGLVGLDTGAAGAPEPAGPPEDMTADHTKKIAEGDDPLAGDDEEEGWDDRWAEDDAYAGEAIKLISFVLTVEEYGQAIDALERIADREGLETNADVVLWLIEQYAPEEE